MAANARSQIANQTDLMDLERTKFGRGPRELGGAVDLIDHYKLGPIHELFCRRSLPSSISETHYLQNVVGETEIRKGEGMELDQLFQSTFPVGNRHTNLHPFDYHILREAFQMREPTPIDLSYAEKGRPMSFVKLNVESKDKKKHKKHKKYKIGEDSKEQRHKDSGLNEDGEEIRNGHREFGYMHLQTRKDKQKNSKVQKTARHQ